MNRKTTDDLRQELMETADLDRFLRENRENFRLREASEIMQEMFSKRDVNKSCVARRAGMSEVYLHQLFSGRRNPTRNKVLCFCVGLGAEPEEAQELLKACGHAPLYIKDQRDAVILFGLNNHLTLQEINDALYAHELKALT